MKATGIIRSIDKLGRIVIPKELREQYEIEEGDVEIYTTNEGILLKPFKRACDICSGGSLLELKVFKGKKLCPTCIKEIKEEL